MLCKAKRVQQQLHHILDTVSFKSGNLVRARDTAVEITAIETYVTRHAKMVLRTYADSIAKDRPAHPRSLI